jgi:hypothetical protein
MQTLRHYKQVDLAVLQAFNPHAGLQSTLPSNVSDQADDLDLEVLGSFNPNLGAQGAAEDWPPDIRIPTPCNKKCSDKQRKNCDEKCGDEGGGCLMVSWNGGPCTPECACVEDPEEELKDLSL